MGTHRKPSPPGRVRTAALATAIAGASVLATATAAHAEPSPTLDAVKTRVDELNEQAEASIERYNKFKEKQQQLQGDAGRLQDRVAGAQDEMNRLRTQLGALAAQQYRSGGIDPSVQLMLSSDPSAYLDNASLQDLAADSRSAALRELQDRQRRLDQQRAEAGATLAELESSNAAVTAEKKQIQEKLAQAQALLNKLSAADRAKVNAQDAAARASRSAARETYTGPATGRAAAAIQFAYAQLGKPYGWGATGPNSFDCSGLTGAAWRTAGVSLPRVSQDQWNAGRRVARADLQPGDLVFFYSDLHHVGLYIGDGRMIHAPRTGKNVEILPISAMPYVGGVRP